MAAAYRAGRFCRAAWNGPFHIGRLAQPASVGDVLLKVLETFWRSIILLLLVGCGLGAALYTWTVYVAPALFPLALTRVHASAVYDDGKGELPPAFQAIDSATGARFRCGADYPVMVAFQNLSNKPISDVMFDLVGRLPGYTTNYVSSSGYSNGGKILAPRAGWFACYRTHYDNRLDPRKLALTVKIRSASYVQD